jgi:hypothetical protein
MSHELVIRTGEQVIGVAGSGSLWLCASGSTVFPLRFHEIAANFKHISLKGSQAGQRENGLAIPIGFGLRQIFGKVGMSNRIANGTEFLNVGDDSLGNAPYCSDQSQFL